MIIPPYSGLAVQNRSHPAAGIRQVLFPLCVPGVPEFRHKFPNAQLPGHRDPLLKVHMTGPKGNLPKFARHRLLQMHGDQVPLSGAQVAGHQGPVGLGRIGNISQIRVDVQIGAVHAVHIIHGLSTVFMNSVSIVSKPGHPGLAAMCTAFSRLFPNRSTVSGVDAS